MKKVKNKWSIMILMAIAVAALIASIFIQFKSVDESNEAEVESMRESELKTEISSYKQKYEEAAEKYNDNQNKINEYNTALAEDNEAETLLKNEYEESEKLLGLTDVEGEGVIITLEDGEYIKYSSEDLRNLVNELKYAGAEAISINDNRIINLTDIVTLSGDMIVMNGGNTRISSPYVVKAIGDRTYLSSTLNTKTSGFVDLMKSNGLSITVEESNNVEIGKYEGELTSKYMKEEE